MKADVVSNSEYVPPHRREPSTDPAIVSPLKPFKGEKPPAPAWFHWALERAPERTFTSVDGVRIETLIWGERGKPGLLFLHGNGAHADWYSFIAPFFADDYRVVAMSWSGMGLSDWREEYSIDQFGEEAMAVARATGLFDGPRNPIFVAHSFGGGVAIRLAATQGQHLHGAVILDTVPRPPHLRWTGPPDNPNRTHRIHPTFEEALARFRLMPPQGCENLYLVDHIGRLSLRAVDGENGAAGGFSWRFDPQLWPKMDRSVVMESEVDLQNAKCPLALIWGQHSLLVPDEAIAYARSYAPPGTPMCAVPDAQHHLMLDQPLATIAAVRTLLSAWP